jgi:hypothetical protein
MISQKERATLIEQRCFSSLIANIFNVHADTFNYVPAYAQKLAFMHCCVYLLTVNALYVKDNDTLRGHTKGLIPGGEKEHQRIEPMERAHPTIGYRVEGGTPMTELQIRISW